MKKKIPAYLIEKGNIIKFLLFTAVFALIFLNIYIPFSSHSWLNVPKKTFFLYSGMVVTIGLFVLTLGRVLMYKLKKYIHITYGKYVIWILSEMMIIALIYSTVIYSIVKNDQRTFLEILETSTYYTFLVLFLPYTISFLYLALKDREKTIEDITNSDASTSPLPDVNEVINFNDEKGVLKLSVKLDHLYYVESADNYINIYYLNKGKMSRFLLRSSLKQIEKNYDKKSLVRCHRQYVVNFNKVKVLRKEKEGLFLEFDLENVPDIPVSKTYSQEIMQLFSKCTLY